MKKQVNQRGFTLVEIIVVLVILAIIAAFTIPAMLGYIQDANKKKDLAEARTVMIALQSTISEVLGTENGTLGENSTYLMITFSGKSIARIKGGEGTEGEPIVQRAFSRFSELIGSDAQDNSILKTLLIDAKGKISLFQYETADTLQTYSPIDGRSGTDGDGKKTN